MRRFRPNVVRSEPENKGGTNNAATSNQTATAPTRRARIKPKVGIVGNSRTGISTQRRNPTKEANEATAPECVRSEVIPSTNIPLVKEKEVGCLSNNSTGQGDISANVSQSSPSVQAEQHAHTSCVGSKRQPGHMSFEHEVIELAPEDHILDISCTSLAQPEQNVHSTEETNLQVEPGQPVFMDKGLLLQASETFDVPQTVEMSNNVQEHTQECTAGNTEVVTESQLPDSNLDFNQLQNADDLLQNLLRNESTSLETVLHSNNTDVIMEVIPDSQQGDLMSSAVVAFSVLNNGAENITSTSGDATRTPETSKSVSGSSLNTKRRRTKPRSRVPRKPENLTFLPQLDISEIPIARNVEIDIDMSSSETLAVDHPVLELPVDLIEDNMTKDHPQEKRMQGVRGRFRKRGSGSLKMVVSRQGVGNTRDGTTQDGTARDSSVDSSQNLLTDDNRNKEVSVKRRKVGPNLTSGGRRKSRRNEPEQTLPSDVPDDNVGNVTGSTEIENQKIVTEVSDLPNNLEDISLCVADDVTIQSLHNTNEPLSTLVECPQNPINLTSGSVTDDGQELRETSFNNDVTPEGFQNSAVTQLKDNQTATSCTSEVQISVDTTAESIPIEAQTEKQPNKEKVVRKTRKVRGKAADSNILQEQSEGTQGVGEGLTSQDTGDLSQVSQDVSGKVAGVNKRQRKVKPKTPGKRGRRKAGDKEPSGVTKEMGKECEQGTDDTSLNCENETSACPAQKDNTASQKRKKRRSTPSKKTSTDISEQNDVPADDGTPVRKKGKRRQARPDKDSVMNISSMRISDMVHYNPRTNPMKTILTPDSPENESIAPLQPPRSPDREQTQEIVTNGPSTQGGQSEIILPASGEEQGEPSVDGGTRQASVVAPQVTIDADGNIVLDEESLVIQSTPGDENLETREVVFENANQQYRSTIKRKYMDRWDKEETLKFYKILSQTGTDFSLMATIFPKRNRTALKRKFKREEKLNRDLIEKALSQRNPIPASLFAECLEETEQEMDRALVVSPQENVTQV